MATRPPRHACESAALAMHHLSGLATSIYSASHCAETAAEWSLRMERWAGDDDSQLDRDLAHAVRVVLERATEHGDAYRDAPYDEPAPAEAPP